MEPVVSVTDVAKSYGATRALDGVSLRSMPARRWRCSGPTAPARRRSSTSCTVRNHLSVAIQKLGFTNRAEAALVAEERGWL